jgi:glycosyltransferase involved in cell wall biosynthesis
MDVSIVVPLLNEAESLPHLMKAIVTVMAAQKQTWEVVFVDDGSTDASFEVCRDLHRQYPDIVRVFRFSRNYGKASALGVGIAKARGNFIITMDADLQDDPVAIPSMLAKLDEGFDLVSGWKKKRHDPLVKKMPSKLWNVLTSTIAGIKLHDFNCGFKAYRSDVAKNLEIYGERHRYLPVLAHWNGARVTEIVVPHHPRAYGISKYGAFSRGFKGIFDLLTIVFLRKYLKNPLHFFGLLGLVFGLAGSGVMAWFGIEWAITHRMHLRPLMLLAIGAIIMGIQFVSIGLLGEMITHAAPRNTATIRESIGQS